MGADRAVTHHRDASARPLSDDRAKKMRLRYNSSFDKIKRLKCERVKNDDQAVSTLPDIILELFVIPTYCKLLESKVSSSLYL